MSNLTPLSKDELRSRKPSRAEHALLKRHPISIVLDSLKCAHNIGTILRLGDALLVEKIFICGDTIVPPNGKIRASSRGSERWVPWEYRQNAAEVVRTLKEAAVTIVSAEITGVSVPFDKAEFGFPTCLVLGREYDGVSSEILALSDAVVFLPIYGMTNSLNVSVAASVVLYDMMRRLTSAAPSCLPCSPANSDAWLSAS